MLSSLQAALTNKCLGGTTDDLNVRSPRMRSRSLSIAFIPALPPTLSSAVIPGHDVHLPITYTEQHRPAAGLSPPDSHATIPDSLPTILFSPATQVMVREGAKILGIVAERDDSDPRALLAELFQRISRYKGKLWPE